MKLTHGNEILPIENYCANTGGAVYAFSNENLGGYMPTLCAGAKSALVVASSGDHVINAVANGVTEVTAFDYSNRQLMFCELKLRAMAKLSYHDFREFFENTQGDCFMLDQGIMSELVRDMTPNAQTFWANKTNVEIMGKDNCSACANHELMVNTPAFENATEYNIVKDKLGKCDITLVKSDIEQLPKLAKRKPFDVCALSNIDTHLDVSYMKFIKKYVEPIMENVNKVQTHYRWCKNPRFTRNMDVDYAEDLLAFGCTHKFSHLKFTQSPFRMKKRDCFDVIAMLEK